MAGSTLWTWGGNANGQLGDGTTVTKSSPVQVGTLATWSVTAQGAKHTLAIKTDSTLWTWGQNNKGQMGDGTTVDKSSPVQVGTLASWAKIAGTNTTGNGGASFAIKTDSTIWAWGYNGAGVGVLGLGDSTDRSSPTQIGTLAAWADIGGRDFGANATKTDSTLWGWGYNDLGQLGIGVTGNKSSPVQVGTLSDWKSVGTTGNASSAIKTDSTLWEWGFGPGNAEGNATSHSSPVQVGTLKDWLAVSHGNASNEFMVSRKTDSTLWSWGTGAGGALGTNSTANVNSPVQIGTLAQWSSQSIGTQFGNAVRTDSTLWSWGLGTSGQLGDNTAVTKSSPIQVGTLALWTSVSSGAAVHAVALQGVAAPATTNSNFLFFM